MGTMNNQAMKELNIRLLLRAIRRDGPTARSVLARSIGLTSPAVTNIVSPLVARGILLEKGSTDIPLGRKPVLLDLNPDACHVLGMVLTTESICVVLADFKANLICRRDRAITPLLGKETIINALISGARECMDEAGIPAEQILGLGIGAPGPLNIQTGELIDPPNFADWADVPICKIMEDALGIPAVLDKETNAAALAEYYFGNCKDAKTAFYVYLLQNSIGGCIIQDGKITHGFEDRAGDIGHTQVDPNGPRCSCGNYGCLEVMAGGKALLQQARRGLRKLNSMSNGLMIDSNELTLEDVFRLSNEHVPLFENIISQAAQMIAMAIGNTVTLLSPSLVTIGGSIPQLSPTLVSQIRTYVHQRPYPRGIQSVRIEPSVLGEDGCAVGAAMLALEKFQVGLCCEG